MTSVETRLESESSQDMSQDSIFGSKEETWTPKIRTSTADVVSQELVMGLASDGEHLLCIVDLNHVKATSNSPLDRCNERLLHTLDVIYCHFFGER